MFFGYFQLVIAVSDLYILKVIKSSSKLLGGYHNFCIGGQASKGIFGCHNFIGKKGKDSKQVE